jgi:hypothetical protein
MTVFSAGILRYSPATQFQFHDIIFTRSLIARKIFEKQIRPADRADDITGIDTDVNKFTQLRAVRSRRA